MGDELTESRKETQSKDNADTFETLESESQSPDDGGDYSQAECGVKTFAQFILDIL